MFRKKDTGAAGEKLAIEYLKKHGYRIVETNYRCRQGEIDIVARQKECLVFIEVRTKRNLSFGSPEESLSAAKKARMRSTAMHYLQTLERLPDAWRIDFVAVELDPRDRPRRIQVFENAVGE